MKDSPAGFTFRKKERLTRNSDFRALIKKGRRLGTPLFHLYVKENLLEINRIGIAVPGKIGNAPARNKCRRRLREIYRINKHLLKQGFDILVLCRGDLSEIKFEDLKNDFLDTLKKAVS